MRNQSIFRLNGFGFVTFAAIIWGTIGVATQSIYTLDNTSALFINLVRTSIATPILCLICWRVMGRAMFRVRRRDLLMMFVSGVFLGLSQLAYFESIRYVGVTIATLLTLCVSPVLVALFSVLLKTEQLNTKTLLALLFAIVGSALLVLIRSDGIGQGIETHGILLTLISATCYACMLICGRFLAEKYHPLQVTSIGFFAGTVLLVIIGLVSGFVPASHANTWWLLLYLGLVPTAFAYWLFQMGLRSVTATSASIVIMLDPLVSAILAFIMFGETLSIFGFVGASLLMSSLFLLSHAE